MIKLPITRRLLIAAISFACIQDLYCQEEKQSLLNTPYKPSWHIQLDALYLQPTYSLGSFTQNFYKTTTTENIVDVSNYNTTKFRFGWGSKLDLSYLYKEKRDIAINWYHLATQKNQYLVNGVTNTDDSIYDIISDTTFYANILWSAKTQWDAINFEIGYEPLKACRLQGGIQIADIQTTVSSISNSPNANNSVFISTVYTNTLSKLSFKGIGPRLGMDLSYDLLSHFSIFAGGSASLLTGSRDFKITSQGYNRNTIPPATYTGLKSSSNTIIVPELQLDLGGAYSYLTKRGNISAHAGWMWINYFSVLSNPRAVTSETKTDFGVQGPYIGIKWLS